MTDLKKRLDVDIVVVGGGPVGALAALGFANAGASVVIAEQAPGASRRLAGEWIHPDGYRILRQIAGDPPAGVRTRGFIVIPDDGSPDIVLDYGGGSSGLCVQHHLLVAWLRELIAAHPGVQLEFGARASIRDGRVILDSSSGQIEVRADLIVAADGRSSRIEQKTQGRRATMQMSWTGGLLIDDPGPDAGPYGRVFLGGPGPVLLYPVGDGFRLTFDLPATSHRASRNPDACLKILQAVLPEYFHKSISHAIRTQGVQWAACGFRPRTRFGQGNIVLAGDAAGYFHPLTAAGLTLGFQDVATMIANEPERYRALRYRQCVPSELLSNALYLVMSGHGTGAAVIRSQVLDSWRNNPEIRRETISLLACEEMSVVAFSKVFSSLGMRAVFGQPGLSRSEVLRGINQIRTWGTWPLGAVATLAGSSATRLRTRVPAASFEAAGILHRREPANLRGGIS